MPPKKGGALKWGSIGVALLAIIGLTVVLTITFTRGDKDGGGTPGTTAASGAPSGPASDIASANDTGPATIITEDPTCAAWTKIAGSIAAAQTKTRWDDHDYKIPATSWPPDLREMYEMVGDSMSTAADQAVELARQTPHRIMRELYSQFVAYARAFVSSLNSYVPADTYLSAAALNASTALLSVCESISHQSAVARAPFVPVPQPPAKILELADLSDPQRFMVTADADCEKWKALVENFRNDSATWGQTDPHISQSDWSADQQSVMDAAIPIINKYADDIEAMGSASANATIADFAAFSAQYWRAYVASLPTYTSADYYLTRAAARPVAIIVQACQAFE